MITIRTEMKQQTAISVLMCHVVEEVTLVL